MTDLSLIPLPFLVLGGVAAFIVLAAMITNVRWAHWVLGTMLFVSSISIATDWKDNIRAQWLYPLQGSRSTIFMLAGLLISTVVLLGARQPARAISMQGGFLLAINLYNALFRFMHEGFNSGVASIFFAMVTIGALLYLMPALLSGWDDLFMVLRTVLYTYVVWTAGVAVQYFFHNPKMLISAPFDRFIGLTGNAQSAAIICAVIVVIALWLALNDPKRRYLPFYLTMLAIGAMMVVWTGSRTGALMTIVGVVVSIYGRVGRTVLLLPVFAMVIYGGYKAAIFLNVSFESTGHIVSTADTRTGAWAILWEAGLSRPLTGVGVSTTDRSENSYLYAFASAGIGLFVMTIVYTLYSMRLCLRLYRLRWSLASEDRAWIDLVLAYNAMYFLGAHLEGYILGRVAAHLIFMIIFAAIATRVVELVEEESEWAAEHAHYESHGEVHGEAHHEMRDGYDDGYRALPST